MHHISHLRFRDIHQPRVATTIHSSYTALRPVMHRILAESKQFLQHRIFIAGVSEQADSCAYHPAPQLCTESAGHRLHDAMAQLSVRTLSLGSPPSAPTDTCSLGSNSNRPAVVVPSCSCLCEGKTTRGQALALCRL